MNIPTKVLRSTFITYEAYFHHQQLAKRFYKSAKGKKGTKSVGEEKTGTGEIEGQSSHSEKNSFKEDLMKWFFSMSLPERIKAVSIENKWFSTMVQHMYTKFKFDQKIRFQLKLDDISTEELYYQQCFSPPVPFSNELNLENFFFFKNDRYINEDRSVNETLFMKELRYYSLREQNDTLTLSTNLLENEPLFRYYLETFSSDKAFLHYCSVSFDNVLKVYNWDFPEWFNPREYNSISEFIVAYIEQVLSIRFWFALEEKREKLSKNVSIMSFSLCEEPNFNELFDNREKLINFLTEEYKNSKEKLFSSVIDLKKILSDLKNDSNLMSKVKKQKPESMKNYFYLINKTKFELFEPPVDTDHETIEKIKKFYLDHTEEHFIDELIFGRLETLNTLEDFLVRKIFDVLHNIYTEKNAKDLMNEEIDLKKNTDNSKSKRGRCKKSQKKKVISNCGSENKSEIINIKSDKNTLSSSTSKGHDEDSTPKSADNHDFCSDDSHIEHITKKINKKIIKSFSSKDELNTCICLSSPKHEEKIINYFSYPSENSSLTSKLTEFNPISTLNQSICSNINLSVKSDEKKSLTSKVVTQSDNSKMSWRKMTPGTGSVCIDSNLNLNSNKIIPRVKTDGEEEKNPHNRDEKYVNDLVKNLLNKIIYNEEKPPEQPSNHSNLNESESKTTPNNKIHQSLSSNKNSVANKSNKVAKNKSKLNNNLGIKNNIHSVSSNSNNSLPLFKINKPVKSNKQDDLYLTETNQNNKSNMVSSVKSKAFTKKEYIKEKDKPRDGSLGKTKKTTGLKSKDYLHIETEDSGDKKKLFLNDIKISENPPTCESPQMLINPLKNYSSDNECKIETTMNHEIIQNNGVSTPTLCKIMVDNYCQTEQRKDKLQPNQTVYDYNVTTSEAVHSTTQDEDEKPFENRTFPISSQILPVKSDKPIKKKKKNLLINNFKADREDNVSIKNTLPNSINDSKKVTTIKTGDGHLDLKKSISEGYQFNINKKELKINSTNSVNTCNYNLPTSSSSNVSSKNSINLGPLNKKPTFTLQSEKYTSHSHTTPVTPSNLSVLNYQEEDYQETEENYSFSKSRYGYNKANYGGGYYKRGKYGGPNNYHGINSNKFNNIDSSYPSAKPVNNRGFYSRPNFEYNNFYPSNNFTMLGNYPMYPPLYNGDSPNFNKEAPVFNNYYIINSNVNINNVHNINNPGSKDDSEEITGGVQGNLTPRQEPNKNLNMFSPYSTGGMVCNNYMNMNFSVPDLMGNPSAFTHPNLMMNFNPIIFPHQKSDSHVHDSSSLTENSNIMNKIEADIYPFIFHYRIHNDILEYSNSVTMVTNYLKEIKLYIIKYLEKCINKALGFEVETDLYGSFATDLSIESSDIDITIKLAQDRNEVEIEEIIEALCVNFRGLCLFETINPILTASVPVIKILVDPMKILEPGSEEIMQFISFKNSDIFKNYKFDQEELLKIKVDLTFIELNKQQAKVQSTKNSLDWARKTLSTHPEIKPILHVLKRYLQIKKLNSSFNGGLSSFSLFLLIVAYIKYPKIKTRINLGRILIEMLELFGKYFQFAQSIIDVNSSSPFVFTNDFLENFPVILDPVTGLNVAKNSFRIEEVRESLSNAYDYLNRQKILFDKKDLSNSTNIILDLMMICNTCCKFI